MLSVRGGQLDVEVHGLFGITRHHWSRAEVKAVRAGMDLTEHGGCGGEDLCIAPQQGPPVSVLSYRGKEEVAWMAQHVQQALGLRAEEVSLAQTRDLNE
jgi:hypothetical protein